ncbi:MAG: site-2 protease family protein [Oscillospiraceae bacterium]|nr:site-2 protease family protein [Oscillospiraceae bacterium]
MRDGFDFTELLQLLQSVIPALICITLHELSHGLTAFALGDDTAKRMGRLTLNPIKHLDPMGLLMIVIFHFGWAKPVPVNMYRFRHPKRDMALTALAGPVSNVLIALLFMLLYGALYIPLAGSKAGSFVLQTLQLTAWLSLGLAVFNLIPLPPLDGSKVLFSVLSDEGYGALMRYERYGSILLLILVATGVLSKPLSQAVQTAFSAFIPISQWACDTVYLLFYK